MSKNLFVRKITSSDCNLLLIQSRWSQGTITHKTAGGMAEAKEIKRYLLQQTKHNMGRIISRKYAFQGLYLSGDNSVSH